MIRQPPESLRLFNKDLFDYLNELWQHTCFSNPFVWKENLSDDGNIDLPDAVQGFGFTMAGNNEEFGFFRNTDAGVVTLGTDADLKSTNTVNTDSDAKFCIIDNGTNVRIRNRLGATKEVFVIYFYYP
jgi:hypothetical protein